MKFLMSFWFSLIEFYWVGTEMNIVWCVLYSTSSFLSSLSSSVYSDSNFGSVWSHIYNNIYSFSRSLACSLIRYQLTKQHGTGKIEEFIVIIKAHLISIHLTVHRKTENSKIHTLVVCIYMLENSKISHRKYLYTLHTTVCYENSNEIMCIQ